MSSQSCKGLLANLPNLCLRGWHYLYYLCQGTIWPLTWRDTPFLVWDTQKYRGELTPNSKVGNDSSFYIMNLKCPFYLSVCLSVCLSIYLSIYLSTYLPTYLRILSMAALGLSCGTRDLSLQCAGSSMWRAGSRVCRLSSWGVQAPECMGSVVAACGPSCRAVRGILVPRRGIEATSPALEGGFLTTGLPGKSLKCPLYLNKGIQ